MQRVLVIVEDGRADAYYDTDNVYVAIIDLDGLAVGDGCDLPDNWDEWAADFPVAYADINERVEAANE